MNNFFKLNIISLLYALGYFILVELQVNVYRINRIAGLSFDTMNIISIVFIISATIIFVWFTRKIMNDALIRYWSIILWFPYFALFTYAIPPLIPIVNPGDQPGPGMGLVFIFGLIAYPIYLLFVNVFATKSFSK